MKIFALFVFVLALTLSGQGQKPKDLTTASERAAKAAAVITQIAALGEDSLPVEYLRQAKAVVVFPNLTRVNILLSELVIGNGIAALRSSDGGWSVPTFLAFKGSDTNLKIAGKKSFDTVFLVMDDATVERLKKGDIGFDSGTKDKVLLGPVIRGQGTEATMARANLIYYTFEKGQLVDANLSNDTYFKYFGILHDSNMNKAIYGLKTRVLFSDPPANLKVPEAIEKFRQALTVSTLKSEKAEPVKPAAEEPLVKPSNF